mgnify:CR=1 FL=1
MDLIILIDGFYSLVPVTQVMLEDIKLVAEVNCLQLCEILRLKLSTYATDPLNAHVMNDGSGDFFGCICN